MWPIVLLLAPLTGCLIPLASDLGLAHSYLNHHHLFKPVLPELPTDAQTAGDPEQPVVPTTAKRADEETTRGNCQ